MKLRHKIGLGFLGVIAAAVISLGVVLSYNADCEPGTPVDQEVDTMQAIVYRCYGPPDVLQLEALEKPEPTDNEVLIRVNSAGVNPYDWHFMRGSPYIMRLMSGIGSPHDTRLGVDFSGTVEAVGPNVSRFSPGDEVFGGWSGAFGEYVLMPEDRALASKPENVSFEEAAAVPIAAVTALQALRDAGGVKAGQKVLINGASGGVGTYAVQIAKSLGAEVHGVCSTRNVDMVSSLGADRVFDYKTEDYTESGEGYDVILDNVGNHSLGANRRVMKPDGVLVMVGGMPGDWLGPLMRPLSALIINPLVSQELSPFLAELRQEDMQVLAELLADGRVKSVIDRSFPLQETAEAIRYSETGRARGKIIIAVESSAN